jgi:xanthine dehydrogenase YagT iron-sulfur-binding subunit
VHTRDTALHQGLVSLRMGVVHIAAQVEGTKMMTPEGTSSTRDGDLTEMAVTLKVNGEEHALSIDPRMTLLDCLRELLHLTGTKKGCDHGQCGACTVHVDDRRLNSCLALAAAQAGREIVTIEGLGAPGHLHPMQAAFLEKDAYQCGYCTSGQIMSAVALLNEPVGPSDDDVREFMSGNICRCGAYPNIIAAIQQVRRAQSARG